MALQLKKRNFKLSSAVTGALVIGAGLIIIKTFPHLKSSISTYICGAKKGDDDDDDNKPIEIADSEPTVTATPIHSTLADSVVEITEWSDENLKSFLLEKEVILPPNATHDDLVSLVRSIQ